MGRYDERDAMFSRMAYEKGSPQYEEYYRRHPEKQELDDRLRSSNGLCSPASLFYDPFLSGIAAANFQFLADIKLFSERAIRDRRILLESREATLLLKNLAMDVGADVVGVASMSPDFYYSVRGRIPKYYGDRIAEFQPYGVVFAVQMDREMIDSSPKSPEIVESSRKYIEAAIIGMQLSYFIRNLGYKARNHMDGNYLCILPLVAEAAGLGVFGRHGLIITAEFGPRIKLGLVTTDLPLETDSKLDLDLEEFCNDCGKCASGCPGSAIPADRKEEFEGTRRWIIDQERCYSYWMKAGTDCGLCIKNCPFSKTANLYPFSKY